MTKLKLAEYEPLPSGDSCIPTARLDEIFHGVSDWSNDEETHLRECAWCRRLALWGTEECLTIKQVVAFSFGSQPTEAEAAHLSVCPMCAADYAWAKKEHQADNPTGV